MLNNITLKIHLDREQIPFFALILLSIVYSFVNSNTYFAIIYLLTVIFLLIVIKFLNLDNKKLFESIFFTLLFIRIGINSKYSLFDDVNTLYVYLAITLILGIFIFKQGLNVNIVNKKHKIFTILVLLIFDFMFFGFELIKIDSRKITIVLATLFLFWIVTLIRLIFVATSHLAQNERIFISKDNIGLKDLRKSWLIFFLINFAPSVLMSIIYYPGHISYDNAFNYYCATNFGTPGTVTDIHSMAYVLCTMLLLKITHNYYIITFTLLTAFSIVWASYFCYLYKKGIRLFVLVLISLVWISFPGNQLLLICSWKDNPFSICMLLASFMFSKYCLDADFNKKRTNLFLLYISLVGLATFRSNGLFVLIVIFVISIIETFHQKMNLKLFMSVLLALLTVAIFKGPVLSGIHCEKIAESFSAIPFIDGVYENVHSGNTLEGDAKIFVDDYLIVSDNYSSSTYSEPSLKKETGVLKSAEKAYLWCFKHHPKTTILARLKRTYNIWGVFYLKEYDPTPNYHAELSDYSKIMNVPNWSYPHIFSKFRQDFKNVYSDDSFIGAFQYLFRNCGFHMFLWIICWYQLKKHNMKQYMLIILPAFANAVGLFFGCSYPDYRYFYPMFVLSVPFYCVLLIVFSNNMQKK